MAVISRSMLFLSFLIVFCTLGHAARIIFMPLFGSSHYFVFKKIATEASNRGHEVKLLTPSNLEQHIGNSSVEHMIYEAPPILIPIEERVEQASKDKILSHVLRIFPFTVVSRPLERFCRNFLKNKKVLKEIKEFQADLLVSDVVYLCAPILQDMLDVPRVDVSATGILSFLMQPLQVPCPPSYTPQMGTDNTDEMSFLERLQNVVMYVLSGILREFILFKPFENMKKEFKIRPERSFKEAFQNGELLLVQADFAVEIPRPLPPAVKMIGPVLPEPAQPLPVELEQFMQSSGEQGVILVTFGSMVSKLEASVLKKMTIVFGTLKQKILWKVKRETLPQEVGFNIKTVRWLPQNDVLGHKKTRLFISHVGHNGMYEAFYHGVPVLACPLFGDQFSNANLVSRVRAGKWVMLQNISVDDLEKVINSVLDNPKYSVRATHLSRLIRDRQRTPVQEAADSIEYVLRNKNLRHLHVASYDIPWYQYYLLDVILFVVALVTALVFVVGFFCKFCCSLVCRRSFGKQKAE